MSGHASSAASVFIGRIDIAQHLPFKRCILSLLIRVDETFTLPVLLPALISRKWLHIIIFDISHEEYKLHLWPKIIDARKYLWASMIINMLFSLINVGANNLLKWHLSRQIMHGSMTFS